MLTSYFRSGLHYFIIEITETQTCLSAEWEKKLHQVFFMQLCVFCNFVVQTLLNIYFVLNNYNFINCMQ